LCHQGLDLVGLKTLQIFGLLFYGSVGGLALKVPKHGLNDLVRILASNEIDLLSTLRADPRQTFSVVLVEAGSTFKDPAQGIHILGFVAANESLHKLVPTLY